MCGIMGFNFQTNHPWLLRLLHHRGPDNASKVEFDKFTLIHNRLSIVDHNSKSNQPFKSSCGRYTIVFNGEIYNYKELKNKLKNEHDFITDSDTEVLLYLYIKYDKECLKYLRGMFAFAIYDKVKDRLFCARDRVGIKPFIYYFKDGKFIFGSELNSIFSLLDTKPKINQESILQYLKYLYIPYPNTIFEHIYKLSPAHILIYENKSIKIEKYWDSDSFIGKNNGLTESEILCKLDILFNESIKLQMISDVELCSFLSGGIDSSLIFYYIHMLYYRDIMSMANSFEVRFPLIDHKIIEFMTSIDSKWRIKNGQTKYLMRKLLTGKIPDSIINKKKLGLNPPIGIWLKNDLRILISNYLSKEIIEKRGLFEYGFIQQMIYEFDNNIKDRSLNIWALIVLEEWFRQYVDN